MVDGESDRLSRELKELFFSLNDTIVNATNAAIDAKQMKITSLTIDLPGGRKLRKYMDGGRLPEDFAHAHCPFCTHGAVDEPLTNGPALSENTRLLREWTNICS